MRVMIVSVAGLLLAACATTTDAETVASANSAGEIRTSQIVDQGEAGAVSNDDVVCRSERVTGQLRRERICRTVAEWRAIREAGRDTFQRNQATGQRWGSDDQTDTNPHGPYYNPPY